MSPVSLSLIARTKGIAMLSITEEANGKEIELAVGESFELQLPENRTTGYKWKELPSAEPVTTLERVKEDNVPRTAQGNLVAGGGRPAHWRGRAIREVLARPNNWTRRSRSRSE
jgi:predicted secreted protein